MPLVDRRSNLTSMNARVSDVAQKMVEQVAPIHQQRMMAAFRVQGLQGILYSRLNQGPRCTCHSRNNEIVNLDPDGKASAGAINRVLTGSQNFGVSDYKDRPATADEEFDVFGDDATSPNNAFNQWMGTDNTTRDNSSDETMVYDDGQSADGLDLPDFDLNEFGLSDVTCPICFGSNVVGGYSMMRGFRKVFVPSDFATHSVVDPLTFELSPGEHTTAITVPRGVTRLDVFRVMRGKVPVAAKFYVDNQDVSNANLVRALGDGIVRKLRVVTDSPMTHVEIQFALSEESMYFEVPKRTRTPDLAVLEQHEPFQIIVSPDVPQLYAQDIIVESQLGKHLIVTQVSPWNTKAMTVLGHEVQVRVAQPQELYTILPLREHVLRKPKTTVQARPSKSVTVSGFKPARSFKF